MKMMEERTFDLDLTYPYEHQCRDIIHSNNERRCIIMKHKKSSVAVAINVHIDVAKILCALIALFLIILH